MFTEYFFEEVSGLIEEKFDLNAILIRQGPDFSKVVLAIFLKLLNVNVRIDGVLAGRPFFIELRFFGHVQDKLGAIVFACVVIGQKEIEFRIMHFHFVLLEIGCDRFLRKVDTLGCLVYVEPEIALFLFESPRYDTAWNQFKVIRLLRC